MGILSKLKRLLLRFVDRGVDVHASKSYSQEGEDLVLARILGGQARGFYVDVGAHHPRRFSNTQIFYERGWRGINIEPNPEALPDFVAERSRDINLQIGISDHPGSLTYYWFDDPALNTFDPGFVQQRLQTTSYKLVRTAPVPVERLADVLAKHLPTGTPIDFLTVDVEGHDLQVLRSNDWERFRPKWVLAEVTGKSLEEVMESELVGYMKGRGYLLFAKTFNTLFFRC